VRDPTKEPGDDQRREILDNKIIIGAADGTMPDELIELVARARISEKDPLIGAPVFQQEYFKREGQYMRAFIGMCRPLQRGWAYKYIRLNLPDLYRTEINEMVKLWDSLIEMTGGRLELPSGTGMMILELYAVFRENPDNEMKIEMSDSDEIWQRYIDKLDECLWSDPDPRLYLDLVSMIEQPYTVEIKSEGGRRFFDIREKLM
jgi:hypothetical protein